MDVLASLARAREALPPALAARLGRAVDLPGARPTTWLTGPSRLPTGLAPFDTLLGGGLPRGSLVELSGRGAGARFSLAVAALAAATSRGESAALVDLGGHLDPQGASEAGVDLARLLWVRPRRFREALAATEAITGAGFRLVVFDLGTFDTLSASRLPHRAGGTDRSPCRLSGTDRSPCRLSGTGSAPWIRLARAAAAQETALLVSSPFPLAGPAATALVLAGRARGLFHAAGATTFLAGFAAPLLPEKLRSVARAAHGTREPLTLRLLESSCAVRTTSMESRERLSSESSCAARATGGESRRRLSPEARDVFDTRGTALTRHPELPRARAAIA